MRPVLTHVALHCDDIDANIAFYRRYCGLHVSHSRGDGDDRVVWMAEEGKDDEFVLVLLGGGPRVPQPEGDFSHLGYAMDSPEEVDKIAAMAREDGTLMWEPREFPFPVGYFCGVRDPDGKAVEFSYGQPLGPGAEEYEKLES